MALNLKNRPLVLDRAQNLTLLVTAWLGVIGVSSGITDSSPEIYSEGERHEGRNVLANYPK